MVDGQGLPIIKNKEREAALQEAIKVVDDYMNELMLAAGHDTDTLSDPVLAALLEARNRIQVRTEWSQDVTAALIKEQA